MPRCLCTDCGVKNCSKKKIPKRRVIGKKNRVTGKYAENKLYALFNEWGIGIEKTFCSGSKKELAHEFGDKFSGDFNIKGLVNKNIKIENKKKLYSVFKRYYELTNQKICHIEGFCYLVPQDMFEDMLIRKVRHSHYDIADEKFKVLHNFFDQDNADIVTLISPKPESNRYLNFIFCVSEDLYKILSNKIGD